VVLEKVRELRRADPPEGCPLYGLADTYWYWRQRHAWADGSFRKTAGLRWPITRDDKGSGPVVAQGSRSLGPRETAFDAGVAAIEAAVDWYRYSDYQHLVVHSDSTSAIARVSHSGAGPGQSPARRIHETIGELIAFESRSVEIFWTKAHVGTPRSERADKLAGEAVEKTTWSQVTSISNSAPYQAMYSTGYRMYRMYRTLR